MSFNTNNALGQSTMNRVAQVADTNNWFKCVAVVDVSGMEFSFSTATTKAGASASVTTAVCNDGATTGVGTAALFTAVTNSPSSGTAWTDITVRNQLGTSATDLDADDVVNLVTTTAGTAASGFTASVAYLYGKPSQIN